MKLSTKIILTVILMVAVLLASVVLQVTVGSRDNKEEVIEETETDGGLNSTVTLEGLTVSAVSGEGSLSYNGADITIFAGGEYDLSGQCASCSVVIDDSVSEDVILNLDSASFTAAGDCAIRSDGAANLTLNLPEGSSSTLTAGTQEHYNDTEYKDGTGAAVRCSGVLTVTGSGSLALNGYDNTALRGSELHLQGGSLTLLAKNNGIRLDGNMTAEQGAELAVTSPYGSGIKLGSGKDSAAEFTATGCTLNIEALECAISADTTVTLSAVTGTVTSTDKQAVKSENIVISNSTLTFQSAEEGLDAGTAMEITDCTLTVNAGMNALESGTNYTDDPVDGTVVIKNSDCVISSYEKPIAAHASLAVENSTILCSGIVSADKQTTFAGCGTVRYFVSSATGNSGETISVELNGETIGSFVTAYGYNYLTGVSPALEEQGRVTVVNNGNAEELILKKNA